MIISICGDAKKKENIINELKKNYGDSIVICNYYHIFF